MAWILPTHTPSSSRTSTTSEQQQLWLFIWVLGSMILASSLRQEEAEQPLDFWNLTASHVEPGEEQLMTLTKRLVSIDNIVNCAHETLCTSETAETHRFFPDVPLASHQNFALLAREKINLIAYFVQQLKSKERVPRRSFDEDQLIGGILEAIQSSVLVKQVRWVTYFPGSANQTHWVYKLNDAGHNHGGKKDVDAILLGRMWDVSTAAAAAGAGTVNGAGGKGDKSSPLTVVLNVSDHDIQRFPWFLRPPAPPSTELLVDGLKFDRGSGSSSSLGGEGKNRRTYLRGPQFGLWTWPYFICTKINTKNNNNNNNNNVDVTISDNNLSSEWRGGPGSNNYNVHNGSDGLTNSNNNNNNNNNSNNNGGHHGGGGDSREGVRGRGLGKKVGGGKRCDPVQGLFLLSYTAGFPMYDQARNKVFGMISFDVDLSNEYINQCDYASEEEMLKDRADNPLHVFRGTHKCDRNSTRCQFSPVDGEGWRQGSYVCRCHSNHHAAKRDWNNSIPGYSAELAWWEWKTNLSADNNTTHSKASFYRDIVTCNQCPLGCEDCLSGESCLADIGWIFRITLLSISMVSIACTAGMILIVYKYRRVPVLKSSSPIFHCIVLVGCIIMYCEMIALFPSLTMEACIAVKWTRHLGFCITYTALYMKLCRVYLTFRVKSAHKIKLTEKHLLHWMSPIMVIMLLYLCAWTLSSPPNTEVIETSDNKRFIQCVYNWWDHALAAGEVIFLSYGVWICWRIRENPDAQFISYSIYNIAIINILMVALHLIIVPRAGPDTKYLFAFIRTQMSTTVTIALVFGSKLYCVLWGKPKELKEMPSSANGFGHDTLDLAEENQQLKEELQKLAGQMERLKGYAMGKNNPHLKQSSTNISSADLELNSNRMETFTTL